jgi:hypothetical protein
MKTPGASSAPTVEAGGGGAAAASSAGPFDGGAPGARRVTRT